jgi:hypothetical protein
MKKVLILVLAGSLLSLNSQLFAQPSQEQEHLFTALNEVLNADQTEIPREAKTLLFNLIVPLLHPTQLDEQRFLLNAERKTDLGNEAAVKSKIKELIPQGPDAYTKRFVSTINQNAAGIGKAIKGGAQVSGQAFTPEQKKAMAEALEAAAKTFRNN